MDQNKFFKLKSSYNFKIIEKENFNFSETFEGTSPDKIKGN
jgi:hypothetical protein